MDRTTLESLSLLVQVIGYAILAIVALVTLGVSVGSALFGGTVFGLVVGLALQTPLSNVFSGLFLIASRPFNVGDRVTILTWQYGITFPSQSQSKFWSQDYLIPGYTGTVVGISLMYTTILTDDNVPLKIPNNVVIQAAVFVHNEEKRRVRARFQVPSSIEPDEAILAIKDRLKGLDFIDGEPDVKVLEAGLDSYVLGIDAMCKGVYEEPYRSEILKVALDTIKGLKARVESRAQG